MPTVRQLIENLNQVNKNVVTTAINEPLAVALNKMLEHDFTQLPFLHENKYYFLTTASILSALSAYGGTIRGSKLEVINAKLDVTATFTEDDDIFDVMKEVERRGAALILDDKGIKNIITPYDTTSYFQQRSEDTMHVREIEREIKDIINLTFKDPEGMIDLAARQAAVVSASSNFSYTKEKIVKGLKAIHHMGLPVITTFDPALFRDCFDKVINLLPESDAAVGDRGQGVTVNRETTEEFKAGLEKYVRKKLGEEMPADDVLKKAFPDVFGDIKVVEFDNLTLAQYILILLGSSWDKCKASFKLEKDNIAFMLDGVRETRNKLAHFHEENITPQDRSQLRLCNEHLQRTKREMSGSK